MGGFWTSDVRPGPLAAFVDPAFYVGIDTSQRTLAAAKAYHPDHRFLHLDELGEGTFDTIAALAVIEHLPEPSEFMRWCADRLESGGEPVVTTGIPQTDWLHDVGSRIGLLSREAHEEHISIMGKSELTNLATETLELVSHRYFLLGVNHFAVFGRV